MQLGATPLEPVVLSTRLTTKRAKVAVPKKTVLDGLGKLLSNIPATMAETLAVINAQKVANLNLNRLRAGQSPAGDVSDLYGGAAVKKGALIVGIGVAGLAALLIISSSQRGSRRR